MAISLGWLWQADKAPRRAWPRLRWPFAPIAPALKVILDKPDDHLLRDIGLTREDALGAVGSFWYERSKQHWSL